MISRAIHCLFVLLAFLAFAFTASPGQALDLTPADRKIIEAAGEKARELDASLLPIYIEPTGGFVIPEGYSFKIHKGRIALLEGQLVVNIGYTPVVFGDAMVLTRGEYALVIYNGLVKKGCAAGGCAGSGLTPPGSTGSFSKTIQRFFFNNY